MLKSAWSQRILCRLTQFLYNHAGRVLILFFLLTLVFASYAVRLEQKTTLRDLMPADNPAVQRFEETVNNFDLVDRVVVVIQFDPEDLEAAETFAEIFVEQVESVSESTVYLDWIRANLYAGGEDLDWFQYLEYLGRLIPEEQIPNLIERLQQPEIERQLQQNRRDLASGLAVKSLIENDPLNLMDFAGHYSSGITGNYQINFTDGFLVSKTRDMLLVLGKPKRSPEDVDFSVALTAFLDEQVQAAKEIFAEEEEIAADELLQVGLTGPHPITARENAIIKADVIDMFITSFAMVIFLFVLAYRRPLAIIYVGIPLLLAEIWTMGLGYLMFGRLNLLTATFSAVIVGLGIDYAIHIFSRYLDERSHGHDCLEAMQISLTQTGRGTITGGMTTALAFLAMGLGTFSGIREFAVMAAVGIALCLMHMFVTLPCLLFVRESWRKEKKVHRAQWDFHLEKLIVFCLGHRRKLLAIFAVGTVVLLFYAVELRFTTDMRAVRARSNPSINLQAKVTEKVGGSLRSMTFVLQSDTEEGLYAIHDAMLPTLNKLKDKGDLVRFDSLLVLLKNPEAQRRNTDALKAAGLSSAGLKSGFETALDQYDFRYTDKMQRYIHHLGAGLERSNPVSIDDVLNADARFVRPFLNRIDGRYKTVVHVYPSQGLWEKKATTRLTEEILNAAEGPQEDVFITGIFTISEELKTLVMASFKYSTVLAFMLVLLILWLHFRTWSLVVLTLTPLMVAVIWMLGAMKLLGIDITIINFVATPIIIGIGIDDGVHIVEKYLYRGKRSLAAVMTSCGKAVTLTSLTTIFGFSSLFLADYSGFTSLGLCAIMGVFFCWLGSVVLLPLLMDQFDFNITRQDPAVLEMEANE